MVYTIVNMCRVCFATNCPLTTSAYDHETNDKMLHITKMVYTYLNIKVDDNGKYELCELCRRALQAAYTLRKTVTLAEIKYEKYVNTLTESSGTTKIGSNELTVSIEQCSALNDKLKVNTDLESNGTVVRTSRKRKSKAEHRQAKLPKTIYTPNEISRINKSITIEHAYITLTRNRFTCKFCSQSFATHNDLRDHYKRIKSLNCTIEAPYTYFRCRKCKQVFNNYACFDDHFKENRNKCNRKVAYIKCLYCDRAFLDTKKLNGHLADAHRLINKQKCTVCLMNYYGATNRPCPNCGLEIETNETVKSAPRNEYTCVKCCIVFEHGRTTDPRCPLCLNERVVPITNEFKGFTRSEIETTVCKVCPREAVAARLSTNDGDEPPEPVVHFLPIVQAPQRQSPRTAPTPSRNDGTIVRTVGGQKKLCRKCGTHGPHKQSYCDRLQKRRSLDKKEAARTCTMCGVRFVNKFADTAKQCTLCLTPSTSRDVKIEERESATKKTSTKDEAAARFDLPSLGVKSFKAKASASIKTSGISLSFCATCNRYFDHQPRDPICNYCCCSLSYVHFDDEDEAIDNVQQKMTDTINRRRKIRCSNCTEMFVPTTVDMMNCRVCHKKTPRKMKSGGVDTTHCPRCNLTYNGRNHDRICDLCFGELKPYHKHKHRKFLTTPIAEVRRTYSKRTPVVVCERETPQPSTSAPTRKTRVCTKLPAPICLPGPKCSKVPKAEAESSDCIDCVTPPPTSPVPSTSRTARRWVYAARPKFSKPQRNCIVCGLPLGADEPEAACYDCRLPKIQPGTIRTVRDDFDDRGKVVTTTVTIPTVEIECARCNALFTGTLDDCYCAACFSATEEYQKCSFCDKWVHGKEMQTHLREGHDQAECKDDEWLQCTCCAELFNTPLCGNCHDVSATSVLCEYCGKSICSFEHNDAHMSSFHGDVNMEVLDDVKDHYKCSYCGATVGSADSLYKHIELIHVNKPTITDVKTEEPTAATTTKPRTNNNNNGSSEIASKGKMCRCSGCTNKRKSIVNFEKCVAAKFKGKMKISPGILVEGKCLKLYSKTNKKIFIPPCTSRYLCSVCPTSYCTESNVVGHIKTDHSKIFESTSGNGAVALYDVLDEYVCHCTVSFGTVKDFVEHVTNEHNNNIDKYTTDS